MVSPLLPENIAAFLALARGRIDRLDARLLVQEICGLTHAQVIGDNQAPIVRWQSERLLALLERRAQGEPLAYLIGHDEFRGRRFDLTPDVLIPRPETEELVERALEKLRLFMAKGKPRCVDLGTGSGVIAISLKLECPQAEVQAVDVSAAALTVATENARRLGADVCFHVGSWYAPLARQAFDVIVANPPYVAADDPHLHRNGLPHEPQMALTDGGDGLECLRAIVAQAPIHLYPGGWLLLEHGYDQGEAVRTLLAASGFVAVFTDIDLSGNDRVSGGRLPEGG